MPALIKKSLSGFSKSLFDVFNLCLKWRKWRTKFFPIDFPVLRDMLRVLFFFFPRPPAALNTVCTCELTSSVFSPPLSLPVASHKGALGALAVNLYPHGTCWSPWHLSPSGWPQSRYGSCYNASKSKSAGIVRHWQAATTERHAVGLLKTKETFQRMN